MKTLGQVLQATIAHHRNRVAILDETQKLTWWEFGVQVSRAADVLMSLGINKGERFGVLASFTSCPLDSAMILGVHVSLNKSNFSAIVIFFISFSIV